MQFQPTAHEKQMRTPLEGGGSCAGLINDPAASGSRVAKEVRTGGGANKCLSRRRLVPGMKYREGPACCSAGSATSQLTARICEWLGDHTAVARREQARVWVDLGLGPLAASAASKTAE